jgi:hypothetical protein
MPERHRFMKGIFAWPGFKVAAIEFQANIRTNDTRTSWSFFKLWRFALDGLFSFSTAPLKLWTYIGALSAGGAFLYLLITVIQKLFFGIAVPGYASLLIVLLFFNGLLLISNGIQGEYIARIFEEVKGRPLYVVGQTFGFDAATLSSAAARSGVPATMPSSVTAQHVAPPPSPSNATQIGIATGPQAFPTYAPPAPIPPSSPPATQPSRVTSPTKSPLASEPPRVRAPSSPPVAEPRMRTPSVPPSVSPEPLRTRAPSSPPVESPRVRAPSSPPMVAESKRAPTAPPIAVPAQPSSPHLVAPIESAVTDATVPTPTSEQAAVTGERRPRHELPKPKGPPLPR